MTIKESIDFRPDGISGVSSVKPLEIWAHTKNFSMIVEVEQFGQKSKAIYYPEKGVRLTTDIRIPKPYEVCHHIAYSKLCESLGWDVAIPAIPFSLEENDCGALSPFYDKAKVKPHYFFESLQPNDTWIKIAVLDYLSGLIDRTSNDVLFLPDGTIYVTDNGLSFVEGVDFVHKISVIRKALKGCIIPQNILGNINYLGLSALRDLNKLVYNPEAAIESIILRKQVLLDKQKVI